MWATNDAVAMNTPSYSNYQERVEQAAEAALKRKGNVGPLDLFQGMGVLYPGHVQSWRNGDEHYRVLRQWIQLGPEKFRKAVHHFEEWAKRKGLRPIEVAFTRRQPSGVEPLQVTEDGDPEHEKFYRTHYASGELSDKRTAQLADKLNKAPDLVVFEKVSVEGNCSECGAELLQGDYLTKEKDQPLCLKCADMDHLVFLPSGEAALTRRARKYSSLSAVVVRFSRARKRYERQGLLVTEEGLAKAEEECAEDAPARAEARARAAVARQEEDHEFVDALALAILQAYPGCPAKKAREIAEHTGRRSSGRVGRSAAGRALDPTAVKLAVVAHIRHAETNYDELLCRGVERLEARTLIGERIDQVLAQWSSL